MFLRKINFISLLLAAWVVLCSLPAAGNAATGSSSTYTVLKSASELDYPPFAIVRPDGTADGFSVDLLVAVTKAVGFKPDIATGPWHKIKQQLADGELDVLPLVSYSPERDAVYDFTAPYLRMHGTIFVRKGNKTIRGKADLKDKEVMVMRGDTAHEYALRENLTDNLILTVSFEEAMTKLSQGRHDAVIIQHLVGLQLVKRLGISNVVSIDTFKETNLKPTDRPLSGFEQKFCMAVQNGDSELLALLNEGLAIVIANGTYDELYDKWFSPILPRPPVPLSIILTYLLFILGPVLFFLAVTGVWYLNREVARKTLNLTAEITERKQVEMALRESEEKLRVIFDTVDAGITLVSAKGEIMFANRRMADMFRFEPESIIGTPYTELTHESQVSDAKEKMSRLIAGQIETVSLERLYKRKDGSTFWGHLAGSRLYHPDGSFWCLVGVIHDITEQKKLAQRLQQSQKMEAIGTLAGGIAHNFNNILSSIIGFTELSLEEAEPGSAIEDNLQEVFKASIRARDLVKQMLSFARQSDDDVHPIRAREIVEEVLNFISSWLPATIEISRNIQSNAVIMGDSTQFHQILINLFTNAAHAMEGSGGCITVELTDIKIDGPGDHTSDKPAPGNYIKLSVSDTGTGIAPEILGSIFDPYFTTKDTDKGTGMGLAMVHGIIENYGGHISVDTEARKGTTFTILLPVLESDDLPAAADTVSTHGGTEKILFVDDDFHIVKMQQQRLEKLGYSVTICTDSHKALETFKTSPDQFDLVITDMTMPKMTGDKFAFEIKKIRPDMPVILCTGFSEHINIRPGPDFQIDGFLMKPVDKVQMAAAIRRILG